jgi:hypothetical protein
LKRRRRRIMKNYVATLALLGLAVAFGMERTAQAGTLSVNGTRMYRVALKKDRDRAAHNDRFAARPDEIAYIDKCMCCKTVVRSAKNKRFDREDIADRAEAARVDVSREMRALRSDLAKSDGDIRERRDAVRYLEKSET